MSTSLASKEDEMGCKIQLSSPISFLDWTTIQLAHSLASRLMARCCTSRNPLAAWMILETLASIPQFCLVFGAFSCNIVSLESKSKITLVHHFSCVRRTPTSMAITSSNTAPRQTNSFSQVPMWIRDTFKHTYPKSWLFSTLLAIFVGRDSLKDWTSLKLGSQFIFGRGSVIQLLHLYFFTP